MRKKKGLWSIECRSWNMEYGPASMEYGVWSIEYGVWSMEYGVWSMPHWRWRGSPGVWSMAGQRPAGGHGVWSMQTRYTPCQGYKQARVTQHHLRYLPRARREAGRAVDRVVLHPMKSEGEAQGVLWRVRRSPVRAARRRGGENCGAPRRSRSCKVQCMCCVKYPTVSIIPARSLVCSFSSCYTCASRPWSRRPTQIATQAARPGLLHRPLPCCAAS